MVWSWVGRDGRIVLLMSSLIACGQSRQIADTSAPGDTGGEGTAFAGAAGDAGRAKSGSGGADSGGDGQAGNAGAAAGSQGGNASVEETQGGNAGADETQGGRAGEGDGPSAAGAGGAEVAVCNTGVAKLSVEDAEAAVRAQAGGESSLSLTELEIASAWERLEIQIFVSNSSVPGITDAFAFQGGHLWGRLPSGMAGLRSALVADDALFYTFASGSGVMRAHVVRLSLVNCVLELLESGGYTRSGYLDLYLREDMGELSVESGVFVGFNQWSDGQLYGRLVSAATSLSIVDAMGMIIEPEFPPTM
jgi:hypothetical protein